MFFFVRTQNPRPPFHLDITTDERATMARHVAWSICFVKAPSSQKI